MTSPTISELPAALLNQSTLWCIWIALCGVLFPAASASCQSDSRPSGERFPMEIVIVIPENTVQTVRGACRVAYPIEEKYEKLAGHWEWEDNKPKPILNPLRTDDGRQIPIDKQGSENAAYFEFDTSKVPIEEKSGGEMSVDIHHPGTLTPGVYRGKLNFSVEFSSVSKEGVSGPPSKPFQLTITVVKCGRWLRSVAIQSIGKNSPPVFGQPWEVAVDIEEYSPKSRLSVSVDVNLTVRKNPITLARFGLTEDEGGISFVPPPGKPSEKFAALWDEVLFDPQVWELSQSEIRDDQLTESLSETPVEKVQPATKTIESRTLGDDFLLYNSRTSTTGLGPLFWNDPVIWRINDQFLSGEIDHTSTDRKDTVTQKTRRIRVGFPPLDLLGQLTARVAWNPPVLQTPVEGSNSVQSGFGGFPYIVLADDEPVSFLAAWPENRTAPTAFALELKSVVSNEKFIVRLAPDEDTRGEGTRYRSVGFEKVKTDGTSEISTSSNFGSLDIPGNWEIRFAGAPEVEIADSPPDEHWNNPVPLYAALESPKVPDLLVFADSKPWSFTTLPNSFNLAFTRELNQGLFIVPEGGWKSAPGRFEFTPSPGIMQKQEMARLDSVVKVDSSGSTQFYEPLNLPTFEITVPPSDLAFATLDRSIAFEGVANFATEDQDPATLTRASFQNMHSASLTSRLETYRLPFLFRFTGHDGIPHVRLIPKDVTVRIRSGSDYTWEHIMEGGLIVVFLCVILGIVWVLIKSQRNSSIPVAPPSSPGESSFDPDWFEE